MNFGEWRLISSSECYCTCAGAHIKRSLCMAQNIIILEAAIPYPMDPPRWCRFALCNYMYDT